jgi:hypothetical protein
MASPFAFDFAQGLFQQRQPAGATSVFTRSRRFMSPLEFSLVHQAFLAGKDAWTALLNVSDADSQRFLEKTLALDTTDAPKHDDDQTAGITVAIVASFRARLLLLEEWAAATDTPHVALGQASNGIVGVMSVHQAHPKDDLFLDDFYYTLDQDLECFHHWKSQRVRSSAMATHGNHRATRKI